MELVEFQRALFILGTLLILDDEYRPGRVIGACRLQWLESRSGATC